MSRLKGIAGIRVWLVGECLVCECVRFFLNFFYLLQWHSIATRNRDKKRIHPQSRRWMRWMPYTNKKMPCSMHCAEAKKKREKCWSFDSLAMRALENRKHHYDVSLRPATWKLPVNKLENGMEKNEYLTAFSKCLCHCILNMD